jgi:hypothetical protein
MDSIFAISRPLSAARPIEPEQKRRTAQRLAVLDIMNKGKDEHFMGTLQL